MFHGELQVLFQILNVTKNVSFCLMWSRVTKHVSIAGKGDLVIKIRNLIDKYMWHIYNCILTKYIPILLCDVVLA